MIEKLRCVGACGDVIVPDCFVFEWENDGFFQIACKLTFIGKSGEKSFERTGAARRIVADITSLNANEKYRYFVETYGENASCRSKEYTLYVTDADFHGAKWISDGSCYVTHEGKLGSPSITLRKKFIVKNPEQDRILKLCCGGLFTAYLNGKKLGDGVLEAPFTAYDKRVIFRAYNLLGKVLKGENCLEIMLGDGWFNQTSEDTWGFSHAPWRDNVKLLACLIGEDGFVSDEQWEWTYNKITSNALRAGEKCDCLVQPCYREAIVVTPVGGKLCFDGMPPMRECEKILPVRVWKEQNKQYFDFGKSMSGYCSFKLKGLKGKTVRISYSDRITNGEIDNTSNSMYIFNANGNYQTDEVVLSGKEDFYKPTFVYHGYRYVCVEGENLTIDEPIGYFVHTDLEKIGGFESSNACLNSLYEMSIQAILSNYVGFPTDCPHREKNGWTGDAQLSMDTCVYTFDMSESYAKFLRDIIDCQRSSGQIPAIAPTSGWGYNWGSGPAWDIALFSFAYAEYYYYGRKDVANECYGALKKYLVYLSCYEDKEGMVSNGLGDWNYPKKVEFSVCPTRLTSSCYYLQMLQITAKLSEVLQKGDRERLHEKANALRTAILSAYKNESSLTGLAALTYFDILDKTESIVNYLEQNNYQPHVGILGNKFLINALGRSSKTQTLYKYLTRNKYPSFGYWIEQGQTALCEDFELTNSLNHHMYSPVAEGMLKYFAGIIADKNLTSFTISPHIPSGERFVKAYIKTPCGRLSLSVVRTEKGVELETDIPFGVKAVLGATSEVLPCGVSKRLL